MRVLPISNQNIYRTKAQPNFKATSYEENKIVEKDILFEQRLETPLFTNPISPSQNIMGVKIVHQDKNTINLVSRYNNKTGIIQYNPETPQPKVNVQVGSFQPIIELKDDELGLTILMTRGAKLKGENLSITYNELKDSSIKFDTSPNPVIKSLDKSNPSTSNRSHSLIVTTGYMPYSTKKIVNNYTEQNKKDEVYVNREFSEKLKHDYTIVGLGGGKGSRLKPISDLESNNKPSTPYIGNQKSLLELAVLDTAHRAGNIGEIKFIHDSKKELLNTAGIIINGLLTRQIDDHKPLVILTGDTCNNIDLARALYDFEQDDECAMALVVNRVYDVQGKSCVKFNYNLYSNSHKILDFSDIVDGNNYSKIKANYGNYPAEKVQGKFYSSTNIMILSPQVLHLLKKFANPDGSADFVEFLGLMFNYLNYPQKELSSKYPEGLKSAKLNLNDLIGSSIRNSKDNHMYVKAIIAKDAHGNEAICEDIGTVEDYIKTTRAISDSQLFDSSLTQSLKDNIDNKGVLFFDRNAQLQLEKFKAKYGITNLEGNIIVHTSVKQPQAPATGEKTGSIQPKVFAPVSDLYKLTKKPFDQIFIRKLIENPEALQEESKKMFEKYGTGFLEWYLNPEGYYGAFESFVDNLFNEAKSLDDLLKFMPNWAPWKLEEKLLLLNKPYITNYEKSTRKSLINSYSDNVREIGFSLGRLPSDFQTERMFEGMIDKLKHSDITDGKISCGSNYLTVKRLKGGELNDKFVYLISHNDSKYIVKFDRTNVEDAPTIDGRKFSLYEKKNIRKNKYLAPDSIYSNACISRYLELNGCENIPKMYYFNQAANAAIYEYIEDRNNDLFQNNIIDEEYDGLVQTNEEYKNLNKLGIYLNDTAQKNTLVGADGIKKIIDLGHANFIMPFKPGVKHYNIEFSNSNGPDIRNILASFAGVILAIQTSKKILR